MVNIDASSRDRHIAAFGATLLVHALLVCVWRSGRPPLPVQPDVKRMRIQWVALPPLKAVLPDEHHWPLPAAPHLTEAHPAVPRIAVPAPPDAHAAPPTPAPTASADSAPPPASSQPGSSILDRARHDIGAIDRALRKENKPLIVAPPDSPAIRLQKGIEHANEMAPNAWYQTPKMAELVNQTGDGARRERIITGTGKGTYCMTERAPTTNVEMIEMHGKYRMTTCPEHEEPARRQEWHAGNE